MERPPRWIWVPKQNPTEGFFDESDGPSQHGTCVLARAGSLGFGVAKKADIVIVKAEADSTFREYLMSIQSVVNDIIENGLQKKAVVNYSRSCK
jgi:hypothetical protein